VEDFAAVQLTTGAGAPIQLACSWFLPAGRECVLEATLYGTEGSLSLTNVDGSFYDFRLERRRGTQGEALVEPPDDWGGRALCDWVRRLADGESFDEALAQELQAGTRVLDAIYEAGGEHR
jgi:predicted dehydrogenase